MCRSLAVLALALWVVPAVAQELDVEDPAQSEQLCEIREAVDDLMAGVADVRGQIDRAPFDVSALVDHLDYDATTMVDFVRQSIAFEQYSGSLRGPRGALLSQAGNALDQSLLLAKLLRDAGYDARIAHATLEDGPATALLQELGKPSPARLGTENLKTLAPALADVLGDQVSAESLVTAFESQAPQAGTSGYDETLDTASSLKSQLASAGLAFATPDGSSSLLEEARTYYWVQLREMVSSDWEDHHPAFAGEPPGQMPEPEGYISDTVPGAQLHQFGLQLFIERRVGDKLEVKPVSSAWVRPVANLVDVPISYAVLPTNLDPDALLRDEVGEATAAATFFVPLLNGEVAPGGSHFDEMGNIVDPMAASSAMADMFAGLGQQVGEGIEQLGGNKPQLTAVWAEFTLVAPGGDETRFRRMILDRLGAGARASGKLDTELAPLAGSGAVPLLTTHTVMVAAGTTPRSLVLDRSLEDTQEVYPLYQQLTDEMARLAANPEHDPTLAFDAGVQTTWPGHLAQFSLFDEAGDLSPGHHVYRASPGIIIHGRGTDLDGNGREWVDIVTNPRRAVRTDGGVPVEAPEAVFTAGIWDTTQEGELLREQGERTSTAIAFAQAREQGDDIVVLKPGQAPTAQGYPDTVAAAIQSDLDRGFAVVAPGRIASLDSAGWWRINLQTGETVGQIFDGRGSTMTEYTVQLDASMKFSLAMLTLGMAGCANDLGNCSASAMSCIASAACCTTWNGVGFALGFGITSVALGVAWDIGAYFAPVCG